LFQVLAQLFSIFLSKESFEHLLSPEHQGSHEASAAHEHEVEAVGKLTECISEASTIDGVLEIRSRHFWQLDFGQLVGTMDVRVRRDADEQNVLTLVTDKMSSVVSMLTVQIVKDAAWHNMEGMNSIHHSEVRTFFTDLVLLVLILQ
ncbi:hypothetical protein ANCCEY_00655, partial [Ancylostoma ceylanicum]